MTNTEQQQLLEQLRDIHLPEDVSWWPLAIGWWIIIGMVALLLLLIVARWVVKHYQGRYARYAIAELGQLKKNPPQDWLLQSHLILRRASLCYLPKSQIMSLSDQQWLSILGGNDNGIWSDSSLQLLAHSRYRNPADIDDQHREQFLSEAERWLHLLPEVKRWPQLSQGHPEEASNV